MRNAIWNTPTRKEKLEAARKERALRRKRKAGEEEQPQVPEVLPEGNWMKIDKIKAEPDQTSSEGFQPHYSVL